MSLGKYCENYPNDKDCQRRKLLMSTKKPIAFDIKDFSSATSMSWETRKNAGSSGKRSTVFK